MNAHTIPDHRAMLIADCTPLVAEPKQLLDMFCEHFVEHGEVRRRGDFARLDNLYGRIAIRASDTGIAFRVRAIDETYLTYMKMGIVIHLQEFLGEAAPDVRWRGDGQEAGTPSFWRRMKVVSARDVTPCMRRVVLQGRDLDRFTGLHVRLFFPAAGRPLRDPALGADGCPIWPTGEDELTGRVYTIRDMDLVRGEVTIDILRHDGDSTPGSRFVVNAKAGDDVGMAGPISDAHFTNPDRMFLFGDETAIPAIDRILRDLPAGTRAHAVIEVANAAEEQPLQSAAELTLNWLHRGAGRTLSDAAAEMTGEDVGQNGFVWAGCEFDDFVAIRRHCRKALGLSKDRHLVVAYWRRGKVSE